MVSASDASGAPGSAPRAGAGGAPHAPSGRAQGGGRGRLVLGAAGVVLVGFLALQLPGEASSPREAAWLASAQAAGGVPASSTLAWLLGRAALALPLGQAAVRLQLASLVTSLVVAGLLVAQLGAWFRLLPGAGLGPLPHARLPRRERLHEHVAIVGAGLFTLVVSIGLRQWGAAGEAPVSALLLLIGARCLLSSVAPPDQARGLGAALVCGLAAGAEPAVAALLWPPALATTLRALRRGERWPVLAPLLFACGTLVLLPGLVPGRGLGPASRCLLDALTLAPVRAALAAIHRPAATLALAQLVEQIGAVAALLALLGFGVLVARAPRLALWLGWGLSLCLLGWAAGLAEAAGALPAHAPALSGAALRAGVPAAACLVLLLALPLAAGLARFAQALGRARLPAALAVTGIVLVIPLWTAALLPARTDARRLARAAWQDAAPARGDIERLAPSGARYGKIPRSR